MTSEIIVAVLAFLGTLAGSLAGVIASNSVTLYRIKELEKKVDKHNTLVERMTAVEVRVENLEERKA